MTFDSFWFTYGVPGGALLLAGIAYLWARYESHRLDQRHGNHHLHPGE